MLPTAQPKPEKRGPKPRKRIPRGSRPRRSRKARPGQILLKHLDDLARPLCRNRRGGCEAASYVMHGPAKGCSTVFDWAHIVSRTYRTAIRWSPQNCLKLCKAHHRYFTSRPVEWRRFLVFKIGEAHLYDLEQRALAQMQAKHDRSDTKAQLEAWTLACTGAFEGGWHNPLVIHE